MPVEFDDTGLRIIGHKVKGIQFYDPDRTLRQEIYLQEDNTLNTGDTGTEGQAAAATGGMIAHDISGGYHTGTLSSAQAPQFLLTDGARNLTGDLLVTGASEIQFYDTSLAIYSSADGQLDLKADTEIELTAPTVDVQGNLDVSNGLDVTGNITVTGTVDTVDIQDHSARHDLGGTDVLTTSSNPGAAAVILASSAAGKIQLVGLGIGGAPGDAAIDIIETSIGHLRFTRVDGANYTDWNMSSDTVLETDIYNASADVYWRIKNSHASYRTHIGLNCDGDAQFDLDIGGNLRAQGWIVGKHAIQLEGALAIFHYDGPEPFESNFAGTCTGHMGQVGTTSGGVIFRPGKFQKGVQVAEATTNYFTNPSFEAASLGGTDYNTPATSEKSSVRSLYGSNSYHCITDAVTEGRYWDMSGFTASTEYTISVSAYVATGTFTCYARNTDDSNTVLMGTVITQDAWTRISGQYTTAVGQTSIRILLRGEESGAEFYADAVQIEQKAYVTAYCDGTLGAIVNGSWLSGSGHTWSGAAHASTSSRVTAEVAYDGYASALIADQNSIGGHFVWQGDDTNQNILFDTSDGTSNNRIMVELDASEKLSLYINGGYRVSSIGSGSLTFGDEVFWVVTFDFDADEYKLYFYENDGTLYSGSSSDSLTRPSGLTKLRFGNNYSGTAQCNGILDDCFITDNVMDADEIQAIYESEAPVFAETGTFQFSAGPSQLVWADHEGLWVRNESGESVFGVFAGTGTKSWGNKTLGIGDVLLGDAAGAGSRAWMMWDDSTGDILMGAEAITTVQIDGSTGDFIFGQVATSKSNLFWDQSEGRLNFRGDTDGTVVQAYVDTDGSIVGGEGVVTLNAVGISIEVSTSASQVRSYSFLQSGSEVGRVSHHVSGVSSVFIAEALPVAGLPSVAYITAAAPTGEEAEAVLWAAGQGTSAEDCLIRCNARADTNPLSSVDIYTDNVYIWDAYGDANLRVGGGLTVGSVSTNPPAGGIVSPGNCLTIGGTVSSATNDTWYTIRTLNSREAGILLLQAHQFATVYSYAYSAAGIYWDEDILSETLADKFDVQYSAGALQIKQIAGAAYDLQWSIAKTGSSTD